MSSRINDKASDFDNQQRMFSLVRRITNAEGRTLLQPHRRLVAEAAMTVARVLNGVINEQRSRQYVIAFNDILVVTTPLETDSSVTDAP